MFVQKLNSALKASKLHHGVWNLPHPQGRKALVEPDNERTGMFVFLEIHTVYSALTDKCNIIIQFTLS